MAGSTVTVALPRIGKEMGVSVEHAEWVMLSFLLSVTVLLLIAGRLGDLVGHNQVYLYGFAILSVTSLMCGLSYSLEFLVAARAFQGIGGAMVMATGPALLTTTFPSSQRGRALGILSTSTYIGLTAGPMIAGFIIGRFGWRWIFYINIPVAVVVIASGIIFLPAYKKADRVSFDLPGTLSMATGMVLFLMAVAEGSQWGWSSMKVIAPGLVGMGLLILFVVIENKKAQPLLNIHLFRSRVFSGAVLAALCNYISLFIPIILMPYYLLEGLGISPSMTGMLLSVQPLVMALVASPSGWLSDKIGTRFLSFSGMIILAAGLFGLSSIAADTSRYMVAIWLGMIGLGTGVFISPNTSALMGSAAKSQQGTAGGVMSVARNLGMMIGVATATAIFGAAGGVTGHAWTATDFHALAISQIVASIVALFGAVASLMRGEGKK